MSLQVWLPLNGDLHNQGLNNTNVTSPSNKWVNLLRYPLEIINAYVQGTGSTPGSINSSTSDRCIIVEVQPNTTYTYEWIRSIISGGDDSNIALFSSYPEIGSVGRLANSSFLTANGSFTFTTESTEHYAVIKIAYVDRTNLNNTIKYSSLYISNTISLNGKIGKCINFNGVNDYLYSNYNFYNSTYSVCVWIYSTSSSATQTICCDRTAIGSGFSIFLIGGKLRIDAGGNNLQWTTSYTYPINTWFHLAITYNGTNVSYYINGEYKETKAQTISSSYWGNITSIGASQANGGNYGNYLNGKLNDFRIYNHALSAKEIEEVAKCLVLHYNLDNSGAENRCFNILTGVEQTTSVTSSSNIDNAIWGFGSGGNGTSEITDISNDAPEGTNFTVGYKINNNTSGNKDYQMAPIQFEADKKYTASWWARGSGSGTIQFRIWDSTGNTARVTYNTQKPQTTWTFYQYTFTATATMAANRCGYLIGVKNSGTIEFCGMKLEQNLKATPWAPAASDPGHIISNAFDESGYGYDGVITGTPKTDLDTPRYSVSTYFDGSSYILTPAGSFNWWDFQQGTFCGWMKPTAAASGWSGSIGIAGDNPNSSTRAFSLTYYANSFQVSYNNTSSSLIVTNHSMPIGEWHYLSTTINGTTVKSYFDGELVNTTIIDWKTASIPTNLRFQVAVDIPGGDEIFNGNISDVRFYNTVLTDEQIKELYNTSMTIDNQNNIYVKEDFENKTYLNLAKTGVFKNSTIIESDDITSASIAKSKIVTMNNFYEY